MLEWRYPLDAISSAQAAANRASTGSERSVPTPAAARSWFTRRSTSEEIASSAAGDAVVCVTAEVPPDPGSVGVEVDAAGATEPDVSFNEVVDGEARMIPWSSRRTVAPEPPSSRPAALR